MKTFKTVALSVISTLTVQFVFSHFWLIFLLSWLGCGFITTYCLSVLDEETLSQTHSKTVTYGSYLFGPILLLFVLIAEGPEIVKKVLIKFPKFTKFVSFRSPIVFNKND